MTDGLDSKERNTKELGANGVLQKPLSTMQVLVCISNVLKAQRADTYQRERVVVLI